MRLSSSLSGSLLTLLGSALCAQYTPVNCTLHARVDKYPGASNSTNNYAGLHGMVIGGVEYAIVTARQGTVIYDCSNASSPVERAFISGPGSGSTPYFWREATGLGNYAYIGSEHGPAQVIDMTTRTLVRTFGGTSHTINVDPGAQTLWLNGGAGNGCVIYNLAASATNPPQVATIASPYAHDALPIRGYVYVAAINSGQMRIFNISNLSSIQSVATTTTPGAFTHNVGVTEDDSIAVTTDENRGGGLGIYDITGRQSNNVIQRATWTSPDGATVHNVIVRGQVAHLSSYTGGYYAIDISIPTSPTVIAKYDTSLATGTGYTGAWGAYPMPSGKVYVSDMQRGFFVLEPTCGVPILYGTGTAGTGGNVPSIDFGGGYAKVNRPGFQIVGTKIKANAQAALIIGSGQASIPVLGINLLVNVGLPNVVVSGTANASGKVVFNAPIPNQPGLANAAFYSQIVTIDSAGPQGLAASQGMKLAICP